MHYRQQILGGNVEPSKNLITPQRPRQRPRQNPIMGIINPTTIEFTLEDDINFYRESVQNFIDSVRHEVLVQEFAVAGIVLAHQRHA